MLSLEITYVAIAWLYDSNLWENQSFSFLEPLCMRMCMRVKIYKYYKQILLEI